MFRRSISLGVTPGGWFSPATPVRKTATRSSRWMPAIPGFESGTGIP